MARLALRGVEKEIYAEEAENAEPAIARKRQRPTSQARKARRIDEQLELLREGVQGPDTAGAGVHRARDDSDEEEAVTRSAAKRSKRRHESPEAVAPAFVEAADASEDDLEDADADAEGDYGLSQPGEDDSGDDDDDEGEDDDMDDEDGLDSSDDPDRDDQMPVDAGDDSDDQDDDDEYEEDGEGSAPGPGKGRRTKERQPSGDTLLSGATASKLGLAFERLLGKGEKQKSLLLGSKSVQKRQREEEDEAAQAKKAKLLRIEMRKRGHVVGLKKGLDPEVDGREKNCARLATKAVVQLFNAISKAQKQKREADEVGMKEKQVVKQTKAALLEVLKPSSKPAAGWDVLQAGYTGLEKGSKMKDWEKPGAKEADLHDQVEDKEGSDDSGDW